MRGVRFRIIGCNGDKVEVFGDSMLYAGCQPSNLREEKLITYWEYLQSIIQNFSSCTFAYVPIEDNKAADALENLSLGRFD